VSVQSYYKSISIQTDIENLKADRQGAKMNRPRVLVVNDEAAIRDFFRFNLQMRGYDVTDSLGHSEVFTLVEKEKPDLVILDLMVRGLDGFGLYRRICQSTRSSVIAFNMRGGEGDLLRCLEMGVDDYLGKPIGVDELMARVKAVLRNNRGALEPVGEIAAQKSKL
jgi:DNA-binding response OmpR family regulator